MRFRQCRSCSFWVTRGERFCTNCGVYRPFQSGRGQRSAWLVFTTMLGGALGGSVFYRHPDTSLLLYGCVAGCATGLAWGLGLFAEVSAILQGRRRSPSLQSSELRLAGRLAEILQTRRQVRHLLGRLRNETCTPAGGQLMAVLHKAEGAVQRAVRRYTAELAKLELIRWRNGLDPLLAQPDAGPHTSHRERLDQLHRHREDGHRLLAAWRGAGLDAPELGRDTVRQLERWLDTCDRIMERTIAEHAHATLSSIAAAELVPCPDPQVESELNRIDATAGDLEPDELEQVQHALDRLQAKEQLDRELGPR